MAVNPKPYLNIQCDWTELLRHGGEKAWISCSRVGSPSVYGEITSHGEREEKELRATDGFEVESFDKRSITVCFPKWNCHTRFLAPSNIFSNIHAKSIHGLDISPGGSLGVSSSEDGDLNVWQTSDGTVRRELKGHVTEVTTCRFFPSGVVILSGGSDLQLKIWSAEDGSCPATLKGHKGACSRDGSARLWDCSTSSCLGLITECSCPINACSVATVSEQVNLGFRDDETSEGEIDTTGKLLLIAREDKIVQGIGLHTRQMVFEMHGSAAFNTCDFTSEVNFVAGTQDGRMYKYDVRNTSTPVEVIQRSGSSILSTAEHERGTLIATGDGSCYLWTDGYEDDVSFTGPDWDPVYKVCVNNRHVYTACRDAKIRKYIL